MHSKTTTKITILNWNVNNNDNDNSDNDNNHKITVVHDLITIENTGRRSE